MEDLGVDGRVLLKFVLRKSDGGVLGWIHLTQNRDLRLSLMNTVMKIRENAKNVVFR
jgi:hypothetical protein